MYLGRSMRNNALGAQQVRLKRGIEEVVAEVASVARVAGTAVTQLAEKAHESDQRVVSELKPWVADLARRLCQALRDLEAHVPTADTAKKPVEINMRT